MSSLCGKCSLHHALPFFSFLFHSFFPAPYPSEEWFVRGTEERVFTLRTFSTAGSSLFPSLPSPRSPTSTIKTWSVGGNGLHRAVARPTSSTRSVKWKAVGAVETMCILRVCGWRDKCVVGM